MTMIDKAIENKVDDLILHKTSRKEAIHQLLDLFVRYSAQREAASRGQTMTPSESIATLSHELTQLASYIGSNTKQESMPENIRKLVNMWRLN